MFIALVGSIAAALLFLTLWQKTKTDISFLESKALNFGEREEMMLCEIERLNHQIHIQANSNPVVVQPRLKEHPFDDLDRWDTGEVEPGNPPMELQVAELNNEAVSFLTKLGVNTTIDVVPESEALLQKNAGEAAIPIPEDAVLEQGAWFTESEVTMSEAASLNKAGLHFLEGEIVQKFGEEFVLVSNGIHSYHLIHEKFTRLQPGDKVSLQVLVSQSGEKETIAVWPTRQAVIPA